MNSKVVSALAVGVVLLGIYYVEGIQDSMGTVPEEYKRGPEALSWLRSSENESALASNRFLDTENAIAFVKKLYSEGATKVVVAQPAITDDGVEVYADGITITLPTDPAARERVWRLCAEEIKREGENPGQMPAEDSVFLWWD